MADSIRNLVNDALYASGALGQAEVLSDDDAQLSLRTLKRMLGTWANQKLAIYTVGQGTIPLVGGTASYSTTALTTGRPATIDSVFVRLSNVDYALDLVSNQTYAEFAYKPTSAIPTCVYYDPGYPNGTFYFFPVPSGTMTAYVSGRYPLTSGTLTLDTQINLPDGYEAAIVHNLAPLLAPMFGQSVTADMRGNAADSMAWLKRTNRSALMMTNTLPYGRPYVNIVRGF